jgi:protein-disulfide isomerase
MSSLAPQRGTINVRFHHSALLATFLLVLSSLSAAAQEGPYPIKADDGSDVANHRVPVELATQIERLSGIVTVGNPHGDVTLVEFYDLNCPYCRKAAGDIGELIATDQDLKLVLVPFPVLGVPSIQAGPVELAVAELATPKQFYAFHRKIYAGHGVVDGERALLVARELGFAADKIIALANEDAITAIMKAHARLGDALGLDATPAYVIKGVAILGHPGANSLRKIIDSVRRCDNISC